MRLSARSDALSLVSPVKNLSERGSGFSAVGRERSLILPEVARRLALRELERVLIPPVSIEDVGINPFTGRATISNFVVGATANRRFLFLPTVEVQLSPLSLFRGNVTVQSLRFVRPELYLERTGPGRFNAMELLRHQERQTQQRPLAVTVESVMIDQGKIGFVDETISPPFTRTLENVTLKTGRVSTLPDLVLTPTSFKVRLVLGEGFVTISGKATPLARPAGIELTGRWKNLDPAIVQAYLPERPVFDFNGSWSSGELHYLLAQEVNHLMANIETGPAKLLSADTGQSVLNVTGLSVEDIRWDFLGKLGQAERVVMKEPHLIIERDSSGKYNTASLFVHDDAATSSAAMQGNQEKKSSSPFQIVHLETTGGTIEFLDYKASPSLEAIFQNVALDLKHFSLAPKPAELEAKALLGQAPVQVKGTLQAHPFTTQLEIASQNLPMARYQGYLRALWPAVDEWAGNLAGQTQLALAPARDRDGLSLELSGNLEARKLALGFPGASENPFHAEKVTVQLATLRTHPAFFMDIRQVNFVGAGLRLERDRNGNLNLRPLWASPSEPDRSAEDLESEPPFTIQKLEAMQSANEFVDATVDPAFRTTLTNMTLGMGKLGREGRRTPVSLQATLAESARLQLNGWIELFGGPARINLNGMVRDYDLSQLNPYTTRYIRYEIDRGRVTTDVQYGYDAGDLTGENKIAIRQLRMGDRLGDEFEKRTGVSLSLTVALLQDADGQIRLTVPVSGDLTDPQFDFGSLMWRALQNALVRFLSAPLRFLGNIVTFGGKIAQIRIEPIEFAPGTMELGEKGPGQLKQLAQLMKSKPKIELEIRAVAGARDVAALKKQQFEEAVRAEGGDRERTIARLYRRARAISIFAPLPKLEEMESYLTGIVVLRQEDLEALAKSRVQAIETTLAALGADSGRLWTGHHSANPTDDSPGRIEFSLLA